MTQKELNKEIIIETIKMNGFSIGKIIKGKGLEILLPSLKVFIPLSNYDCSKQSQIQLAKDLIKLEGKELIGEFDDFDGLTFSRGNHDDNLYYGDYSQIHGENYDTLDIDDCEYFNGRLDYVNNNRLTDFWQFNELNEDGWFDEIDPKDGYTIFHRKGKDFYISPSLEEENIEIAFWDGTLKEYNEERKYQEYENCWNTEVFIAMTCTRNSEIETKLFNILLDKKENLEKECYIYNELELGNPVEECFDYNDKVFDTFFLNIIFEKDMWEAKNYILENLDWNKNIKEACQDINSKLLQEFVTFNIDGTMIIKSYQNESIIKLTRLKNLKRLQNRFGYKLVWSVVNLSAIGAYKTYGLAIKVGQEEYHFEMKELFDEEIRVVDFISSILSSIQRRVIMQKAKEKLKTNANKVFVGFEDSLQSGNCYFGTEDFCQRHQIDTSKVGAIRGDILLEMEKSAYTERAVIQAIMAHI